MDYSKEFRKYATKDRGISSLHLDQFTSIHGNYISPTIIEERQMNIATMDGFSRLPMDKLPLSRNNGMLQILQGQLLFLSHDPERDKNL